MFRLDPDTPIYSLKGNRAVVQNLKSHRHDVMKISTISLMELYYGAYKSQRITGVTSELPDLLKFKDIINITGCYATQILLILADFGRFWTKSIHRFSHKLDKKSRTCI